jgi:peptide/nickel transport system substrate-binding protein
MLRQRNRLFLTPLFLLMLILSACGENAAPSTGAGSTGSGTTATATTGATGGDTTAMTTTNATGGTAAAGMIDHLDFGSFGGGDNAQLNYNPYSPNTLTSAYTWEPLMIVNGYNCQVVPWLATDYKWQDAQTLVYTIRDGVTWNDGQPFSADDVVFTFNLLKQAPAFDQNGVWQALDTVTSSGNQVTFKFKSPAANMFTRVSNVLIVPKHVWAAVQDPVKYTNDSAVGTGPFKPSSFNGQQLVLDRVPTYWQADKIQVQKLIFHKTTGGNEVDQLKLSQGAYDTNAMFVPNIQQVYVDKDKAHNHYWYPPGGLISLGFNLTKPPFDDAEFRKAVAYAIDRQSISTKAEFGYVQAASQTGLVLPGQKDWESPDIQNDGMIPYDPKQAADILDKAGYKKDSSGKLIGKDGKQVEFTFLVQNGWTDWIQASQVIQQNLNALGMNVHVQTPSPDTIDQQKAVGNFDMAFAVPGGSCSMYDNFYNYYYSKASAPIGQKATTNWVRWMDPDTDKLIDQLRESTDTNAQKQAAYGLEKIMTTKFPTVALWYGAHWFQYSTKRAVGWPNDQDPYALTTDNLLIITHLKPSPDYKPGT